MSSKKNTYKKIDNEQGFYLDPKTKIIYFIKSIEGKIVKFSCKTENIVTAKRFANKELKRKLGANKKNVTPLLDYWIDKYVKMREESDLSNSAIKNSRTALNQSKGFFKKYRAEEIDKDLWAEFYDWYKSEFNNDFENVFKYFRNFLNWLSEEKHQGRALNFRVPTLKNPDSKKTRRARKKSAFLMRLNL